MCPFGLVLPLELLALSEHLSLSLCGVYSRIIATGDPAAQAVGSRNYLLLPSIMALCAVPDQKEREKNTHCDSFLMNGHWHHSLCVCLCVCVFAFITVCVSVCVCVCLHLYCPGFVRHRFFSITGLTILLLKQFQSIANNVIPLSMYNLYICIYYRPVINIALYC